MFDLFLWLRRHPVILELLYQVTAVTIRWGDPLIHRLGYARVDGWLRPLERWTKGAVFDCRMCGQCILHSTGMVCPMTCPKQLRNGACGGVRSNGHCEVIPDMKCVWLAAYERAQQLNVYGPEIINIKPPVNHRLQGSSAWINMLTKDDKQAPRGWADLPHIPVIDRKL
jgi:Methylene-tetrahydrofolate reductase C terminal